MLVMVMLHRHQTAPVYIQHTTPPYQLDASRSRVIMQTYGRRIAPGMKHAMDVTRNINSEWTYHFLDDVGALTFMQQHCDHAVVEAFSCLIPGAYRADIFRMAWLYVNGGVYIDASMMPLMPFDDVLRMAHNPDLLLVRDLHSSKFGIFQAFIIVKFPHNKHIKFFLDTIVNNVLQRKTGVGPLGLTGPHAVGMSLNKMCGRTPCAPQPEQEDGINMVCRNIRAHVHYGHTRIIRNKYAPTWRQDRPKGSLYKSLNEQNSVFGVRVAHNSQCKDITTWQLPFLPFKMATHCFYGPAQRNIEDDVTFSQTATHWAMQMLTLDRSLSYTHPACPQSELFSADNIMLKEPDGKETIVRLVDIDVHVYRYVYDCTRMRLLTLTGLCW